MNLLNRDKVYIVWLLSDRTQSLRDAASHAMPPDLFRHQLWGIFSSQHEANKAILKNKLGSYIPEYEITEYRLNQRLLTSRPRYVSDDE
jgi:hypothetical protein